MNKTQRNTVILSVVGLMLLLCWGGASFAASPPERINFQGVLRDASGAPVPDGTYPMIFSFYGSGAGACDCDEVHGTPGCSNTACETDVCGVYAPCCSSTWSATCVHLAERFASCQACIANDEVLKDDHGGQNRIPVKDGLFNVPLGTAYVTDGSGPGTYSSLGQVFRDYDVVYVEPEIDGEVLSPRIRVEATAYAQNALRLEGKLAADFLDTSATPQVKVGGLEVQGDLTAAGDIVVENDVLFADGSALKSARPDPPCFDNSNRFADCGNGTVTDQETGLIWLKDADCLAPTDYATANERAASLGEGTHPSCNLTDGSSPGDWRLPTLGAGAVGPYWLWDGATGEFSTIFGSACQTAPFVLNTAGTGCGANGDPFFGVYTRYYWSASTTAGTPSNAWFAYLGGGYAGTITKTNDAYVWPVRGGP